jgi:hypothetical protein
MKHTATSLLTHTARLLAVYIFGGVLLLTSVFGATSFAYFGTSTVGVYPNPSSGTYQPGQQFTIPIVYEGGFIPGTKNETIQMEVYFGNLQYVKTVFPNGLQDIATDPSHVVLNWDIVTPQSGSGTITVATITVNAGVVGSGIIIPKTFYTRNDADLTGHSYPTHNGLYTIQNPPAPEPPSGGSTGTTGSTGSSGSTSSTGSKPSSGATSTKKTTPIVLQPSAPGSLVTTDTPLKDESSLDEIKTNDSDTLPVLQKDDSSTPAKLSGSAAKHSPLGSIIATVLLALSIGGLAFGLVLRRRHLEAQPAFVDESVMLPPAGSDSFYNQVTPIATNPIEAKINETFYPLQNVKPPTVQNDEPLDMFEAAQAAGNFGGVMPTQPGPPVKSIPLPPPPQIHAVKAVPTASPASATVLSSKPPAAASSTPTTSKVSSGDDGVTIKLH